MSRKPSKSTKSEIKHTAVPPVAKAPTPVTPKTPEVIPTPPVTATAPKAPEKTPAVEKTSIKPLVTALNHVDADIAREAATSLGLTNDPAAVEPLIAVITNANGYFHSVVRSAAAVSLGQLKDPRSVEALLNAVRDPIADPSSEAIRALAAIGDKRAVAALIEVVRNQTGFFVASVRRAAVHGLIKLGGPEAIAQLRIISADGFEDAVIREEATAAIPTR